MNRIVAVLLINLVGTFGASSAQPAGPGLHIGILSSGAPEERAGNEQALLKGLAEAGYVEGRNLLVERRYGTSRAQVAGDARDLAARKLDAIVTTCTPTTRLAKEATAVTPIVMASVSDPVGQKLIASLARPGQNVTGLSSQAEDLLAKRLELLREILPSPGTIAVLANADNPVHLLGWQRLQGAARQLGLTLVKVDLHSFAGLGGPDGLREAMRSVVRARAGALFVMPDDPTLYNLRDGITALAAQAGLPDFYWSADYVDAGGLMSYGENLRASYRKAATYVDRIAKGADPAGLPVEQPTRHELVVNIRSARARGIAFPQSVLLSADRIVE